MAEEVLRNLNLSSEERCRLTKCMKDPKFMELLTEYTNEISVPANKEEAEAYIKMAEDRQNFSMEGKELIIPVAGFCVKTRNKNGKKVFINICHTTNIDKPIAKTHHGKGQQWSIPYSLGPARNEVDKSGSECEVYDFVVNEEAHERAMKNNRFKRFLAETAIENVRKQRNVELEQDYTLPKLKYKGTTSNPKMQTVRKAFHESNTSIKTDPSKTKPPPTPNSSGSNIQDTNSSSNEEQPSYEFIYRDDFDLGQFWTDQSVVQNTNKKPKSIVLRMSLPKVESASEVDLNVSGTEVFLHVRGKYKLKLNTAYPVDFKNGRAQFDKANHKLEIVMPTM